MALEQKWTEKDIDFDVELDKISYRGYESLLLHVWSNLIDNAIKTHEQVSREMSGGDWEENVEQLQRENELLTQAGGNKVTVVSASPKEGDGDED